MALTQLEFDFQGPYLTYHYEENCVLLTTTNISYKTILKGVVSFQKLIYTIYYILYRFNKTGTNRRTLKWKLGLTVCFAPSIELESVQKSFIKLSEIDFLLWKKGKVFFRENYFLNVQLLLSIVLWIISLKIQLFTGYLHDISKF